MKKPQVAVIILNWNNYEDTKKCLESLEKCSYKNFDTLVVDNDSTDDSADKITAAFSNVKLLRNDENRGYAAGNNFGVVYALKRNYPYMLILNNDTEVARDFLQRLIKVIEDDRKIGVVVPKIYRDYKKTLWFAGGFIDWRYGVARHYGINQKDEDQYNKIREIDRVVGTCLLVRREVFEKAGLMPEDYFLYFEEVEWGLNVLKKGYKIVYDPQSVIWHRVSGTVGVESLLRTYYFTRNNLLFMKRNARWFHWLYFFPYFVKNYLLGKEIQLLFSNDREKFKKILVIERAFLDFNLGRTGKGPKWV